MRVVSLLTKGAAVVGTAALLATVMGSAARADECKGIYDKKCLSCHGETGKGDGPAGGFLKPPPADFATVLKDKEDADIAKVIKEGGAAVGKAATMPAFGSQLSDEQIQKLVQYIKNMSCK